ncbi:MAG: hypothetical protein IPP44_30635 [Ideonella sp.]|nr:hypothetical protein [Ideonella sp.]
MRACLGSTEAHLRMLDALVSSNEADVQVARTYLRHRPLTDTTELRRVAEGIAGMPASEAQVHALEALGRHYLSDRDILDRLVRLFSGTSSWSVQAAIAGILVRADRASIAASNSWPPCRASGGLAARGQHDRRAGAPPAIALTCDRL